MNQRKRRDHLFSDPGAMAPSVDKSWRDDFLVELRLLDVPGPQIGDALMTVETHVAESGESAQEAFGDARAYARELVPGVASTARQLSPVFVVGNLLGLIGLFVTSRAFQAWLEGGPVRVTVGDLVSAAVMLALMGLVMVFFDRLMRFVMDHPWWVFTLSFVGIGLLIALPTLFLRQELGAVHAGVLGLVGVVLVVVSSVIAYRSAAGDADEIVAPGQQPRGTHAGLVTALALPVATLAVLLITWIPTLFA